MGSSKTCTKVCHLVVMASYQYLNPSTNNLGCFSVQRQCIMRAMFDGPIPEEERNQFCIHVTWKNVRKVKSIAFYIQISIKFHFIKISFRYNIRIHCVRSLVKWFFLPKQAVKYCGQYSYLKFVILWLNPNPVTIIIIQTFSIFQFFKLEERVRLNKPRTNSLLLLD